MKEGATAVGPSIKGEFPFANGYSTLGTGWLGAYFVLYPHSRILTAVFLILFLDIIEIPAIFFFSGVHA